MSREFFSEVIFQGSGHLDLGSEGDYNGYMNWNWGSGETPETATFRQTSCPRTANGSCAEELETGAVANDENYRRTMGLAIYENTDPIAGRTGTRACIECLDDPNKEITLNDLGGAVAWYQIDVYAGLEGGTADETFVDSSSRVWILRQTE